MTDVVNKLWGFCNYLRHDGITYGDYIEQLTYLLFLKMVHEKERKMPKECSWGELIQHSGSELLDSYTNLLQILGKEKGMLGDIFAKSLSRFNNPTNLKKLLNLINEINWTSLDLDIKAAAYEGLLEKYAAEEKGAGQYFTPRVLIRSIVRCVQPDLRNLSKYSIHDPACGTGGFLIAAFEWMMKETDDGSKLKDKDKTSLVKSVFSGMDIVSSTRRLALMNCYIHEIEPVIFFGDALGDGQHVSKRHDIILANPPFGTKGAGGSPDRDDFLVKTPNKQLNFLQHSFTILKNGGQAAIVVPDNVLFDDSGTKIRENLMNTCNIHTILRLPEGTFSPYSPGVKANVIFFVKGVETKDIWYYDLRTNIPKINKGNPLTKDHFTEFEKNYLKKSRNSVERFKKYSIKEIKSRDYNLDIFWMTGDKTFDYSQLPEPQILANEVNSNLEIATSSMSKILSKLNGNKD